MDIRRLLLIMLLIVFFGCVAEEAGPSEKNATIVQENKTGDRKP